MVNVFISYCHKNKKLIEPFLDYIQPLCMGESPTFKIWIDNNDIKPGENISEEIEFSIMNADIALLCLTRKYLISPSCTIEKNRFLKLRNSCEHKKISVLPIVFEECEWDADSVGLKGIMSLNYDARPFKTRDKDAWLKDTVGRLKLYVSAIFQDSCKILEMPNIESPDTAKIEMQNNDLVELNNESIFSIKIPSEKVKNRLIDHLIRFFPEVSIVKSGNYTGDRELTCKYLIHGTASYLYDFLCIISWIYEDEFTSGIDYENLSSGYVRHNNSLLDVLKILQKDYV